MSPEPFSDIQNRYVAYVPAAGASYVLVKDGEIIKMKSKALTQGNMTQHRAEIIAITSVALSVPENAYLDVYTSNAYCIESMMFRNKNTKKNLDLIDRFEQSVGHLADMRMHHEPSCSEGIIRMAKDLSMSARREAEQRLKQ